MRGEDTSMILSMTETDYENWRDDLRCGGREEYDTQYSAASMYEGGWRSDAISDLGLFDTQIQSFFSYFHQSIDFRC